MQKRNIVLIGFMGAGKSLASNKLSKILKREVFSTDALIQDKEGSSVAEIFSKKGEAYFRQLEKQVVKELARKTNVIIDCGGGVPLDTENVVNLKKNGTLVYLAASVETLYQNINLTGRRQRPLMNVADPKAKIAELLEKRKAHYEKADYTIQTDGKTVDQFCEEILQIFR